MARSGGDGGEVMGPAELKPLLLLSKRKPVPCAVGLTKDRQGVILLHKRTKPRKLMAALLHQCGGAEMELDRASVRFGRVSVDGGSDSSTVHVTINKEAPGAMRMALVAKLRPAGFQRCEIGVDAKLEDEGDEAEAEGEGEGVGAGAGAGGLQPGTVPAGAAAVRTRLTGLVRRALAVQAAGSVDPALKATALTARDALASGDLAAAGQATDRLAALLAASPGPADAADDPLLTLARQSLPEAGFLAPTAPSLLERLAGRAMAVALSAEGAALAGGAAFVAVLVVPSNARSVTSGAAVDGHPELDAQVKRAPGSISGTLTIRAVGGPGRPVREPVELTVDSQLGLHRADGLGAVLGGLSARTVTLTPAGEAYVLDRLGLSGRAALPEGGPAPSAPLQADAGGNTGRLPPGPRVREDGECDEDENMGSTSPKPRLPRSKTGAWRNADGSPGGPGNSLWFSNEPRVEAVTRGKGIPFINGRPDFTAWAKLSINRPYGELTGYNRSDFPKAYEAMSRADPKTFRTAADAERWVKEQGLTPHHALDTCIQFVPRALNELVPHIGSAADLRANPPLIENQPPNAGGPANQGDQP